MSTAGNPIAVGLVGTGYWGPNLLRNFKGLPEAHVVAVADTRAEARDQVGHLHPELRIYDDALALIDDPAVNAVVLAVPPRAIPSLAIRSLHAGKHVLVEKPMAPSLADAESMLSAAQGSGLVTMVDFTFAYSPPVQHLRSIINDSSLGRIHYYQGNRINLGRFQTDVDVIWDLAVHDLAILASVLPHDEAKRVQAIGHARSGSNSVDTAHLSVAYASGFQAFLHVSWMAPMKARTALVAFDHGMVLYDDVNPDEKIRIYKLEEEFHPESESSLAPRFRLGEVRVPRLDPREPLSYVAEAFVRAILNGESLLTDWNFGVRVLRILQAAKKSLATGQAIELGES